MWTARFAAVLVPTTFRERVMPVHDRSSFENIYAGQPRWEIGRPQKALLDVADRITGSVLDAGCGTGENALFFASRGQTVTGFDFLAEPIKLAQQKAAERGLTATFLVSKRRLGRLRSLRLLGDRNSHQHTS